VVVVLMKNATKRKPIVFDRTPKKGA